MTLPTWQSGDGAARLIQGDCLEVLRTLPDCSVDSVVTDPPAGIAFMGKAWDKDRGGRDHWIAWMQGIAAECLRCLKPGGHALVWAIPRTSHWTATAWENAGFDVRDVVAHIFGSGFPKSHNLDGEHKGWGTALKPAREDWILLRKPLIGTVAQNVQEWGTGGLNIDGCRVEGVPPSVPQPNLKTARKKITGFDAHERNGEMSHASGRWPSNLIHDGSEEVVAGFPETTSSKRNPATCGGDMNNSVYGDFARRAYENTHGDSGSAARFFYVAKASKADRDEGNGHPTVKPTALMRYLCRLITPPGGIVLDPFMGSGSTGKAAMLEGFRFIGIEREAEYVAIASKRIGAARPSFMGVPA